MLIGIGVDDMFVISQQIDQTNPRDSIEKRMQDCMMSAGASITITSLTNAAAFFLGCLSQVEGLRSYYFFCGLGVIMLFFSSITIFSAFIVWDIKR
jgi:predicted RND superfamily exporter protein